ILILFHRPVPPRRMFMKTVFTLLSCIIFFAPAAIATADESVQVVQDVKMSAKDAEELKKVNQLLHERQPLVDKIMAKEGLKRHKPQLPKYQLMSENSVQALLNQLDYTDLAEKIGAPLPERPDFETGQPLKNNKFLHYYNNALLRSIAKKFDVAKIPAAVDLSKGDIEDQCFALVHQNNEIVNLIGIKLKLAK
ncbi:MAG: hypothetical protein K2X81_25245, partial [Candidatus Obscuribacterales bacterium]|nr:hypothetical protein [Candidatus Obscuribacterales bacterium]